MIENQPVSSFAFSPHERLPKKAITFSIKRQIIIRGPPIAPMVKKPIVANIQ